MSKVTKNERISTLEDAVAMNWSDMKKIETKISRAMTDMATRISNISLQLEGQQRQIHLAADSIGLNKQVIIMLENEREAEAEPEPQLKQLDQSVFDGLDERWVAASVEENGIVRLYLSNENNPYDCEYHLAGTKYDTTDWQNSLIEREKKELTGSELCRAMLERGDKFVMCANQSAYDDWPRAIALNERGRMYYISDEYSYDANDSIYPINNQGEPLTASEVGL